MKTLRHILSAGLVAGALIVSGSATPANAEAIETVAEGAAYKIYFGGVRIAKARFDLEAIDGAYSADFKLSSGGMVGWFYEAEVSGVVNGAVAGGADIDPQSFHIDAMFGGKPFALDVGYDGEAPTHSVAEPPFSERPWQLTPTEQGGTLDPMSGAVQLMLIQSADTLCDRKVEIYDGRRRYMLEFLEETNREADRKGIEYVECRGVWRRVAGFKPKYMKMDDQEFLIRFQVGENNVAWPIRLEAETEWGTVTAVKR